MATLLTNDFILGAYTALIRDICALLPTEVEAGLEKDFLALSHLLSNHGNTIVTIVFPDECKNLEKGLALGCYVPSGLIGFSSYKSRWYKDVRPGFFRVLYARIFDKTGRLRDVPCKQSIWALRQLLQLFKKFQMDCADYRTRKTVKEFVEVEKLLPYPRLSWGDSDLWRGENYTRNDRRLHVGCRTLQQVFDLLAGLLPVCNPLHFRYRHGPGAVSNLERGTSKFSFLEWSDRLEVHFPFDWVASTSLLQGFSEQPPRNGLDYSRLIAVPKTQKGPRLIASEPVQNQWAQQGVLDWFNTKVFRLPIFGGSIDIGDQTRNQNMARKSSIDGLLATIDLSSASDRLSCALVECTFRNRPDVLDVLNASRTPRVKSRGSLGDFEINIKKFANMGSACTFPVQSYIFFCMAVASVLKTRNLPVTIENIRSLSRVISIYGDDIIIPIDSTSELCNSLHSCFLKVNSDKSFWSGNFRESCGKDWYDGVDVTPFRIQSDPRKAVKPALLDGAIDSINNAFEHLLWNLSHYLESRLRRRICRYLPFNQVGRADEVSVKSLVTASGFSSDHLVKRWNPDYQCEEYLTLTSYASSNVTSSEADGIARLRHWLHENGSRGRRLLEHLDANRGFRSYMPYVMAIKLT